jgi:hypothetical protein
MSQHHLFIAFLLLETNQMLDVYFSIGFKKKAINTYLKLEIRVVCKEFLAFKYVFIFFQNISDDYLYLNIWNLENQFFGTQYPFAFVLAGREY